MNVPSSKKTVRDPRLDFFRGLAMFVIFIAHTPRDFWALWIPARFGFSDATETFVFCSGMASAIAFGAVFDKRGWFMGAARIIHRVWQVYWAHIGLFFAVFVLVISLDKIGWFQPKPDYLYVNALNLQHFMSKTPDLLLGLFTLTYVPNYFDILPMYLVILAMIPIVMGLSRISLWLVAAFVLCCWLVANMGLFGLAPYNFPAEPWTNRPWFFNPLGWQLVFFTGFAFMRGWIKPPKVSRGRLIAAAVIVIVTIPFAYFRILNAKPESEFLMEIINWLRSQRDFLKPVIGKTQFGILRYVHFLATAYLAWVAVGPLGARLKNWGRAQFVVNTIRKVGQQSLAVFIASLIIAQMVGTLFKVAGTDWATVLFGNLIGFSLLILIAHTVSWFKSQPWRQAKQPVEAKAANSVGAGILPLGVSAKRAD